MYNRIINEIKSNLGQNKELNKNYLSSQIDKYKDHPYNNEIIREISRMMWDCLSEDEKNEFIKISENENPIMDILNDISYDIESGKYETAVEKLNKFMKNFQPPFEDDRVSEYHYFTNTLEEIIFNTYIGAEKKLRYIPDNKPLIDLYYIYGFLLFESKQYEKAEYYLKKAMKINPVSSRVILELCEIYKMHTYNYTKHYMYTTNALQYAYYPQDIGRCYRNLGYYYIEENQMETALALFIYSLEYDLSPLAYSEIQYIQMKNKGLELTLEESKKIILDKNIQLGPNPFILDMLNDLADDYMENKLYTQAKYYYTLLFNLTKKKDISDIIEKCDKLLNNI